MMTSSGGYSMKRRSQGARSDLTRRWAPTHGRQIPARCCAAAHLTAPPRRASGGPAPAAAGVSDGPCCVACVRGAALARERARPESGREKEKGPAKKSCEAAERERALTSAANSEDRPQEAAGGEPAGVSIAMGGGEDTAGSALRYSPSPRQQAAVSHSAVCQQPRRVCSAGGRART